MKTCRIFLIILSLSIWLAGCKEDEGKVSLTGLVVNPMSLELAANDSKTIAASPVPPNSSDLVFSWTTSKEGVVNLSSADGPTVWVSGITKGEVIVTVTCNGESVDIPVTVVPAALKAISVNETKISLYTNNAELKQIALTAVPDPEDALGVAFEWSAEPEGIVSFSNNAGATTTVIAEKTGDAIITVRSGEISKKVTVNVSREARLDYLVESVAAQWKFDDVTNLGKATKGEDLEILYPVTAVNGPVTGDVAVEGTVGRADLRAHHGLTGESLENFTIMWDAQYPAGEPGTGSSAYYAGYWNGTYTGNASMFMVYRMADGTDYIYNPLLGTTTGVSRINYLSVGVGSYNVLYEEKYYYPDSSPWMRIVMTISRVDDNSVRMDIWKNGVKVMDNALKSRSQFQFTEGGWIYLLSDGGNMNESFEVGDGDDRPHPLANVAIWGFAMNEREVRLLGTIGTGL
jgi:uncharacterized protein YjdB